MGIKACQNCGRGFRNHSDLLAHSSHWRVCDRGHFWFRCDCNSTLILSEGDVEWFSYKNPNQEQKDSLLGRILAQDKFPRLPSSLVRLHQVLEDEDSSAVKIAVTLREDPILASGIVQIANNLRFSSGQKIRSLEHAVIYIGRDTVQQLALVAALGSFKFGTKKFKAVTFWEEAFLTGSIAEALAPRVAWNIYPDEAYLAGCLCNLGKFVYAIFDPETLDAIAAKIDKKKTNQAWNYLEKRVTKLDHCRLGEYASNLWGLPRYIAECIDKHHELPKFGVERKHGLKLHELVALANQVKHFMRGEKHRIDTNILNGFMSITGLTMEDFESLRYELDPAITQSNLLASMLAA